MASSFARAGQSPRAGEGGDLAIDQDEEEDDDAVVVGGLRRAFYSSSGWKALQSV
jgi:hypothetical protein